MLAGGDAGNINNVGLPDINDWDHEVNGITIQGDLKLIPLRGFRLAQLQRSLERHPLFGISQKITAHHCRS